MAQNIASNATQWRFGNYIVQKEWWAELRRNEHEIFSIAYLDPHDQRSSNLSFYSKSVNAFICREHGCERDYHATRYTLDEAIAIAQQLDRNHPDPLQFIRQRSEMETL